MMMRRAIVCVALVLCIANISSASTYKEQDYVPLYANKVGPFANPSETFEYYTLPFCAPKDEERKSLDLGEVLGGDRLMKTSYTINFKQNVVNQKVCPDTYKPSTDDIVKFQRAIDQDYYFEFFCDDLPLWGFIGDKEVVEADGKNTTRYFLFTHYVFTLAWNGEHVVDVNWEHDADHKADITDPFKGLTAEFTYSVTWGESPTKYEDRMEKYHQQLQPQHLEIHWFSIFNSFVTVLLLTGFLTTILLRILKNDFSRYAAVNEDQDDDDEEEETGWKLLHGDVFRFPPRPSLFCAMIGNGAQLFCLAFGILCLAVLGVFYPYNRGAIFTSALVLFALTSGVAGYVSSSFYAQLGGEDWAWNIVLTAFLFIGPFFCMGTYLNFVAIGYNAAIALPFGTVIVIILILSLVGLPLVLVGGIAGRNMASPFSAPCRTTKVAREIPPLPAYRTAPVQVILAGFLPFSAIYIELYYIFASVWGHKLYTIYGILFLVFLILILVTAFITIALTYFQLAIEDHRWWWRSFFSGGSTGLFVLAYCVFYFTQRSEMSGFLQTSFFFGYMGMICYGMSLMLGAVGFYSSLVFVRYIYRAIKSD